MELSATTLSTGSTAVAASSNKSGKVISSDFETFLQMLTTQARYQDPLQPVDSSQYSAQLAQFSMVEQQVLSNDLLTALSAQLGGGGISQMAGWIGLEARSTAPVQFDGAPITVAPTVAAAAKTADLVVFNANGKEVQRSAIGVSGAQIEWAGVAANGTPFPRGQYSFVVESKSGEDVIASTPAAVYSKIIEARIEPSGARLILEGGSAISAEDVTALRTGP